MSLQSFTVGVAQISPRLGDVERNLELYEAQVREARGCGVDLLVFPELSLTGYALRDLVSTVALRQESTKLKRLAALSRRVALVAGVVEETPDCRFYNTALYFEGGALKGMHRKVYLPTYGMFDEQRYFARGTQVRAFDTRFGRVAILICEDLWHPSTAYLAALDGATVILCPSTSPLRGISANAPVDDNAHFWEYLNGFYAQTFGLYLVYANRVGFEDGVGFWGGSEVIDPFGERIAKACYYDNDFITARISHATVRRKRVMAPLLRDEDIDLTINELLRLRGRPGVDAAGRGAALPGPARRQAGAETTNRRRLAGTARRALSGGKARARARQEKMRRRTKRGRESPR